jgi:4-carboxymuconolactone decarboxylase
LARLDPPPYDELTPEQKTLHADLLRTRKRLSGPFVVWLHTPAIAHGANMLAQALRENGKLDRRLFELIVLTVARHWTAQYAWYSHEPAALAAGLSPKVIAAIGERRRPEFEKADERLVYQAVGELLDTKDLSAPAYDALLQHFGLQLTIETISVAGFYCMVGAVLKSFDISTPAGERPLT